MKKDCTRCWHYCHLDGKCYADRRSAYDEDYAIKLIQNDGCSDWAFDGLEDWEREVNYELA